MMKGKDKESPDNKLKQRCLVGELRLRLALSNDAEISDAEILLATNDTIFRTSVELHLACVDLEQIIKKEMKSVGALVKAMGLIKDK